MADEGFKRKLAAILSADVEGYSRLMDDNEEATVRTITAYRTAINDLVQQYRGRVVDTTGDNLLAEFTSVVDAVNCAVEIQRELAERNAELPDNRKMEFRIGVNLGDVIEEESRIYGDGVNIAARVEAMSKAGGICISGRAYDQVENKLGLEYENLGEHQVKNITRPIRVYRVLSFPGAAAHRVVQAKEAVGRKWRKIALATAAMFVVGIVAVAVWNFFFRPSPPLEPASVEKMAFPLPDKPSIAVMAFANMSGDPDQEYFSDGLTEEIITTLSKASELFVVARQSTFSYKGKRVKVKQVAEELGVRYVLEGSVRKGEDQVRITAQLIDALTGHHIWAERYDRELKNIFAIQDEITKKVVTALEVKLTKGEQARVFARGTDNVEAWALGAKAWNLSVRYSKENMAKAQELLGRAQKLDPDYAFLWTALAHTHFVSGRFGWTKSRAESYKRALECAKKAITLNEEDPFAHAYTGTIYLLQRQHEKAIAAGQKAISIDPNYADGYVLLSQTMLYSGRFEEALALIEKGMRLCPIPRVFYPYVLGNAYIMLGRHEEAIATNKHLLERCRKGECPPWFGKAGLIMSYVELGREEEARAEVKEILKLKPDYSLEFPRKTYPFKDPAHIERWISALRKAGVPDRPIR
jgi:TolB-like protein/class 3 adenylate cyclase